MKLKSFFAKSIEAALDQARRELGRDAMLVQSRKSAAESKAFGEYEVVCAVAAPEEDRQLESRAETASADAPQYAVRPPGASAAKLSGEIAGLKGEIERLGSFVRRFHSAPGSGLRPEVSQILAGLLMADVDADLANSICSAVTASLPPAGAPTDSRLDRRIQLALLQEVHRLVRVDPGSMGNSQHKVLALVGPPGAGKTAMLVKLAVRYGIAVRRRVQILSADSRRVAGCEQLRAYAGILGVGFQNADTTAGLAHALDENRSKDLVLIDTPGLARGEMEDAEDLSRFLRFRNDVECHLVLPASMKSADLRRTVDQYEVFGPKKLVFSRLDETDSFGALLNEPARTSKPVSFLSFGPRIPEDLEEATKRNVVRMILGDLEKEEKQAAASAAA